MSKATADDPAHRGVRPRCAGAHDVAVELQVWPEVPHVFQAYSASLDDAGRALDTAAAFITRHWTA